MRVADCKKCRHYQRRVWCHSHKPATYHTIGMSHAYAHCLMHKKRCLQVKHCEEKETINGI